MAQPILSLRGRLSSFLHSVHTSTDRVSTGSGRLLFMAVVVGAGVGFAAVAFRWLVTMATAVFTGTVDY
ncbi:MAG: hypothetical protein LH624_06575 [Cryobacterium sp.]|nr:hypothetical protein [Cryobacterium sp.]